MLDPQFIRDNPDVVKAGAQKKMIDTQVVDGFLEHDERWRGLLQNVEQLRAKLNALSKERNIEEAKKVKGELKENEGNLKAIEDKRLEALRMIPNVPLQHVPNGSEDNNEVVRTVGEKSSFDFGPRDHLELGEALGIIDTERAAKVSGSRFGYLLGAGAMLELALVGLAMKHARDKGFTPVIPPTLVRGESMEAMGYVERGGDQIYKTQDDSYLVGTSEQSIGPMHQGEVLSGNELPKRYVGFSSCFRREAGTYGKDMRGIFRLHQFDKVEMLSFVEPQESHNEHELFLKLQEELMGKLELPYQVVNIAGEGLGDPAAAKYDIETWMPGQNDKKGAYRETHSTSNTTDYQARRLNIKYQKGGEKAHVHIVNGTAFAIGRIIIALLENHQQSDGSIKIPKALVPYMGMEEITA